MVHSRGSLYDPVADSNIYLKDASNKASIISEDTSLKAGVAKINVPGLSATGTLMSAVWGKLRVINVRGIKFGTQAQIEAFIKTFTDHINVNGLQDKLYYYPLFHPGNDAADAGNGVQDDTAYYEVLVNDFSYRAELVEAGFAIRYNLELFEGTVVL